MERAAGYLFEEATRKAFAQVQYSQPSEDVEVVIQRGLDTAQAGSDLLGTLLVLLVVQMCQIWGIQDRISLFFF